MKPEKGRPGQVWKSSPLFLTQVPKLIFRVLIPKGSSRGGELVNSNLDGTQHSITHSWAREFLAQRAGAYP